MKTNKLKINKPMMITVSAFAVICITAAMVLCSCYAKEHSGIKMYDWERDYFGEEIYSELEKPCPEDDREDLLEIYDMFNDALSSSFESSEKAEETLGNVLGIYALHKAGTYREDYEAVFLTGDISGENAYIWIEYWLEDRNTLDGSLALCSGSKDNPVKVRVEAVRNENKWTVVSTNEHP